MISGSERTPGTRWGRVWVAWSGTAIAAVLLASSHVFAQTLRTDDETRSAARQMARDAIELMNAENYEAAEDLLRRAYDLVPAPTVAVLRGRALEELGRLLEAAESYELARRAPEQGDTPPAFREAKVEARERLERVRGEIPLVTITVTGVKTEDERLEIRLDDKVLPSEMIGVRRPVNPGQHLIVAAFDETVHDTRWVTLRRGEHIKVLMRVDAPRPELPPPPPPSPKPPPRRFERRHAGWLALGVAGGGFATGIVSGTMMLTEKAKLDDGCRPACPVALEGDLRAFRRWRTVSAVSYATGFTGLAVGGALLLTTPPSRGQRPVHSEAGNPPKLFAVIGSAGVSVGGVLP